MKKKNRYAIIGVAGFVAKRHINVLKILKCDLIMASDLHDNVGFLDNFFPNCIFYKNQHKFFSDLKKNNISHVIICTPNFLHLRHIESSFKNNCNVICEKPTVLNFNQLLKVEKLEKKFNKKCFPIFQLRENTNLIKLKKNLFSKILQKKQNIIVDIKYITIRGNWYLSSWKGDTKKSGGLLLNIGVHFVDVLSWFFGKCKNVSISMKTKKTITGKIDFQQANVRLLLSTDKKFIRNKKKSFRVMWINNKKVDFTDNFNNLHLSCYKKIIKNKSISINDIKDTYYNLKTIHNV
tara:strand:- start:1086 stop:1964 length:879 start_codon:yes stop_codon:yes gene_type:complete